MTKAPRSRPAGARDPRGAVRHARHPTGRLDWAMTAPFLGATRCGLRRPNRTRNGCENQTASPQGLQTRRPASSWRPPCSSVSAIRRGGGLRPSRMRRRRLGCGRGGPAS
jgi:hypothetical protein